MKKIALTAILAAALTFTGCEMPFEIRMKGDNSETTSKEPEKSSKQSEKTESSVISEPPTPSDSSENSKPESPSKPSSGNAAYEPVTMDCGEIISSGDVQYFECSSEYGNACEVIYRYIFANGKFDGVLLKIKPGEVKDLKTILENMEDGADSYKVSDFTEIIDGWSLTKDAFEFEPTFQSMSIESLHSLMEMSMLMNQG